MNSKYFKKYLKYKKKYLNSKNNIEGGFLIKSEENNTCPPHTVYLPEKCNENIPCFSNDGNCYSNQQLKRENIDRTLIDFIYDKNVSNQPVIISIESVVPPEKINENNPCNSKNFILGNVINIGGEAVVFQLVDLDKKISENCVIRIVTRPTKATEIDYLSIQYDLSKDSKFLNKVYDYGNVKLKINGTKIDDETVFNIFNNLFINTQYYTDPKSINYINYINEIFGPNFNFSILEPCFGGDLFDRKNFFDYKKNIVIFKKLISNILEGLKVIHEKGFCHLDIKLENIGLIYPLEETDISEEDKNSEIRILDFGHITKIGDITKNLKGTPTYFSPEMELDLRTKSEHIINVQDDIFSIGILVVLILFPDNNLRKIVTGNIDNSVQQIIPATNLPELIQFIKSNISIEGEELSNFVLKCFTVPNNRFKSVDEMLDDEFLKLDKTPTEIISIDAKKISDDNKGVSEEKGIDLSTLGLENKDVSETESKSSEEKENKLENSEIENKEKL